MKQILFSTFSILIFITSCKKDDTNEYDSSKKADLSVEFDNVAGGTDVQLNSANYTNAVGESFKITKLKYFVSNFVLTNSNGTTYTVPQDDCYFLIDESDLSSHQTSLSVPEGEYKTLSFTIGVDSLRNTMDISKRTGALDPTTKAADMYWGWNSGYIFFKIDGTSPAITAMGSVFQYHVGGFGGYSTPTTNNLRKVTLDLSNRGVAKVKQGKEANVHLFVDVLKALGGSTNMSFASVAMIHSPTPAKPMADNYTAMITHDHTEN